MSPAGRKPELGSERTEALARKRQQTGTVEWIDAPEDLSPEAREIWDVALPDLIRLKVFQPSDALLLSEYCSSLAMAREFRHEADRLQRELSKISMLEDSETYDALSGALKRARAGYRQMMQTVMSIVGEFGVTPASRLRLGLMRVQGTNSLLDIFDRVGDASSS